MNVENVIRDKHTGDNEQLDFIFSDEARMIVTAPAGCGKTTAMVSKIARELCSGSISSNKKVLAMTYSVNAAIRIKESVKNLLPEIVSNPVVLLKKVDIANYHNFAMKLLHKYGYALNNELINLNDFQIMDEKSVIRQGLLTTSEEYEFDKLEDALLSFKNQDLSECLNSYWNILNNKLINQKVITYNGILVAAIQLLSIESISHFYSSYYKMIIIDEFQDTNLLGYLLVDKLVSNNKVIFLGDNIQKIYGFLGAIDDAFGLVRQKYNAKMIMFKNNYRFKNNSRMRQMDVFVRDYADNYRISTLTASLLIKKLKTDYDEVNFISEGVKNIVKTGNDVAILVRAGWQGQIIVEKLEEEGIPFFNSLYAETDAEYIKFYKVAVEEFHNNVSGKAVQRALRSCLKAVKAREQEVYTDLSKKYIFDSLYKLMEKLFEISQTWDGTSKDRYINIDFNLGNKGLKHMMEYLDEKVILTTIHSAKGLEWDYIILPQMNASVFPSWKHVCKKCNDVYGCNSGDDSCISMFVPKMERKFKEELSTYYVALTRAKKDVFVTVNTGLNKWNHKKRTNCFINLPGLTHQDYQWCDYVS